MSSQVIRISSGETIQVRTGTIQGIGPQGPVGPSGSKGDTGDQGPQGIPGPAGYVTEFYTEANAQLQSVTSQLTPYSLVSFGTTVHDDPGAMQSTTNVLVPGGQAVSGTIYINFTKQTSIAATGTRSCQVLAGSTVIAAITQRAAPDANHEITLPFQYAAASATTLNFKVMQNEGVSLSITGRLWLSRVGPGVQGPQGPPGAQGVPGVKGDTGAQGPAGTIVTNTTTFAAIGGDDA